MYRIVCQLDFYNVLNPKSPINSENLRKTYLNEFVSSGFIEALEVRQGNTKKIYYPIVIPSAEEKQPQKPQGSKEIDEFNTFPQFFTYYKINVPPNYIPITEKWLEIEILKLWKCGLNNGYGQYSKCDYYT